MFKEKIASIKAGCETLGMRVVIWLALGGIAGMLLAVVELGITAFLHLFLRTLGLVNVKLEGLEFLERFQPSLFQLGMILVLIGTLRAAGQLIVKMSATNASYFMTARFRILSLYELLLLPDSKYISVSKLNQMISEVYPKASNFAGQVSRAISSTVQCVGLFGFMLATDWRCTIFGTVGIVLIGLLGKLLNRRILIIADRIPVRQLHLITGIERVCRNWLLVKVLRSGPGEYQKLSYSTLQYSAESIRVMFYVAIVGVVPPLFGVVLVMALIVFSSTWGVAPALLVGFLYLFIRFLQALAQALNDHSSALSTFPQFRDVTSYYTALRSPDLDRCLATTDRITSLGGLKKVSSADLIAEQTKAKKTFLSASETLPPPSIVLKNVYFSYVLDGEPVVAGLNLHIEPGSQIGIVGKSGSGKSTLLGLILGVLRPTSGDVMVNNVSAYEYFDAVYSKVGYVGPEPFLIEGSIRDNLKYGLVGERTDEECFDALRGANLLVDIQSKSKGLDFSINENGDGLSAGQKQRLSLARAFLARPNFLVLDEASSNLDNATEAEIVNSLEKLRGKVTVVIVSHRSGLLKNADHVYDLSQKLS